MAILKKIAALLEKLPFVNGDALNRNGNGELYLRQERLKAQERQQRQADLDLKAQEERMQQK